MSQVYQADVDALTDLGHRMTEAADRLAGIRGEIDAALGHSQWQGPDADDFRGQWTYRLTGLLATAVNAARAASTTLATNVDQQERASAADGGLTIRPDQIDGRAYSLRSGPDMLGPLQSGLDKLGEVTLLTGISSDAIHAISVLGRDGVPWAHAAAGAMPDLIRIGEKADPILTVAGAAISGAQFTIGMATDPNSDDTWNAGADLAFDAAIGPAFLVGGPAGVGVVLATQTLYDVGTMVDPHLTHQIVDGVGAAATAVGQGLDDVGQGIGDGAAAVGSTIAGGFVKMTSFL